MVVELADMMWYGSPLLDDEGCMLCLHHISTAVLTLRHVANYLKRHRMRVKSQEASSTPPGALANALYLIRSG